VVKWLITGGGGYIGSHLVHRLLSENAEILVLSGESEASQIRLCALKVRGIRVNLSDSLEVFKILSEFKPDVVVHLAALKSPEESNRLPNLYLNTNQKSLHNIFQASVKVGTRVFINASSSAVYGNIDSASIKESEEGKPISAYGQSKKNIENYLDNQSFHDTRICSLRFFNIIGSQFHVLRERATFHLVSATILKLLQGQRPIIYGTGLPTHDGTAIRDYLHVLDAVDAINSFAKLMILGLKLEDGHIHLKVNVGSGTGTSVLEIVDALQATMQTNFVPIFMNSRNGDPVSSISDISLAKKLINFTPKFGLEEMINSCF
jgi:UDP-glucose 4-epimerase